MHTFYNFRNQRWFPLLLHLQIPSVSILNLQDTIIKIIIFYKRSMKLNRATKVGLPATCECHWYVMLLVYPHTAVYIYSVVYCKIMDYAEDQRLWITEDLDSLALEDSYLIWKSHMITGGRDLSLWLFQRVAIRTVSGERASFYWGCSQILGSLWTSRQLLCLCVGRSHQAISQHMLLSHALINFMHSA